MKALITLLLTVSTLLAVNFENTVTQIKHHEGFSPIAYNDMGHKTIGYGTNLTYLTKDEAEYLLRSRLKIKLANLREYKWFNDLNSTRQQVILNMAYQLGTPRLLKFKKMIAALKRKHFITASSEMKRSKWYRQSGKRSRELVKLMRKG